MDKTLLSFGHGYSAQALGRHLLGQGWRVIGTTRSAEKAARLAASGIEARVWPGSDLTDALKDASHILISAAAVEGGCPVATALGPQIVATRPGWIGYLSTTAVYGDHGGAWVDEDTPLTPGMTRGHQRAEAERQWQALAHAAGAKLAIFRLAGIYGPGRGPFEKVRAGTAQRIIKPGQMFSRIHVEDIAQIVAAAMARNAAGVWNVCDDDPAPPQDVLAHAAELLGLPIPPAVDFDKAEMTPMARSFYAENKRVRNNRMKRDLGITLRFPTYRDGLADLLKRAEG
jgi:nucleoside-diphosphate-sugar epimerase